MQHRRGRYLAYALAYPFTLLEAAVMALASVLGYLICRIAYSRLWYRESARRLPPSTVKSRLDGASAMAAMQTLERIAAQSGVRLFWISGTLLGLERLGEPLPHDTDMDAGLLSDDPRLPQFLRDLQASPLICAFAPQTVSLKARVQNPDLGVLPGGIIRYQCKVLNADAPDAPPTKTDLFLHFPHRGGVVHGSRNSLWWNSPLEVTQKDYRGRRFTVPADAHRYLTENYGDYRQEVKEFENCIDCPNVMDIFSWRSLLFLLRRMQVMLRLGRTARAHRIGARIRTTILKGINPAGVAQPNAATGSGARSRS